MTTSTSYFTLILVRLFIQWEQTSSILQSGKFTSWFILTVIWLCAAAFPSHFIWNQTISNPCLSKRLSVGQIHFFLLMFFSCLHCWTLFFWLSLIAAVKCWQPYISPGSWCHPKSELPPQTISLMRWPKISLQNDDVVLYNCWIY